GVRTPVPDAAGNNWITLPGESSRTVIVGGHLDSVPNGGWLDGTLGVLVALEAPRRYAQPSKPPVTVRLVDWADEEGARFGRSLLGSSAAAGTLDPAGVRGPRDAAGARLPRRRPRRRGRRDRAAGRCARLPRAAHRAGPGAAGHGPARVGGQRHV